MQRGRYLHLAALTGALALTAGVAQYTRAATSPPTTTPPPAASNGLPAGFTDVTVGKAGSKNAGMTTVDAKGIWTMTGTGDDVWAPPDRFDFAYTNLPGDGGITARLLSQSGGGTGGWAKTGTMLRETLDPSSADAFNAYPNGAGNLLQPSFREQAGKQAIDLGTSNPPGSRKVTAAAPLWLRTQRHGTTYQHLISNDGKNWQLVAEDSNVQIAAGTPILAGLFITQNGAGKPNVATYDNVSVSADVIQPAASTAVPAPTAIQALPGNGAVLLTFEPALGGIGTNIYRQIAGGTDKPVLVNSTPTANGFLIDTGVTNGTAYVYTLKTVVDLSKVGGTTVEVGSAQIEAEPQVPIGGFTVQYGGIITPATLAVANGMLAITASGSHIWDTSAEGTFLAVPVSGDYSMNAKVLSAPVRQTGLKANSDTKVGPMIRASQGVQPGDDYAWVFTAVGRGDKHGTLFEGRPSGAGSKAYSDAGAQEPDVKYPLWLTLSKKGAVISAYSSNDGTTFTQVGMSHDYGLLPAITYTGIGATSGDPKKTMTATLDAASIQVGAPFTPPATPVTTPPKM